MNKLLVVFVVLGGYVEVAELKYQHNKFAHHGKHSASPSSHGSGQQTDQASVMANEHGDPPNFRFQIKSALRDVLSDDFNLTRTTRQIDRTDAILGNFNLRDEDGSEYPLHEPTGEKTRKTYDFTRSYHVGLSCHDIQATQGARKSGVYLIHPPNLAQGPWRVYCDLESEGGGWIVFQVRDDVEPKENFMRGWEDYKVGFGDFDREFWLGNILIWALTNAKNSTRYELAIDLEDWSGNRRFARYRSFRLGPEKDGFRLHHQNLFYGNAGDSLYSHNEIPFSTFDVDNDNRDGDFGERSCARLYKGGWWYGNCHDSNLNGWYLSGSHRSFADGINWYTWTGYNYSLKKTVMKMRPQINGPIDIGYGNYVLTAPGGDKSPSSRQTREMRLVTEDEGYEVLSSEGETSEEEVHDVPELLGLANTLTNPNSRKWKSSPKTEL